MKKVIIIGATSGIGKALATIYLKNDFQVGITGRRKELLEELQTTSPSQIFIETFDVRADDAVQHFDILIRKMGGMDLLIYNSGYGEVSKKLDWEIDKQIYETNVKGFISIVNRAYNYFEDQGYGQVAAISSIASNRGAGPAPAYSASKAFMSRYMEGLSLKSAKSKLPIFVTDIQPGFVATKLAKSDRLFWVVPLEKAAKQIYNAISKKKRRAYISRRWVLIAFLLKWMPWFVYKRIAK